MKYRISEYKRLTAEYTAWNLRKLALILTIVCLALTLNYLFLSDSTELTIVTGAFFCGALLFAGCFVWLSYGYVDNQHSHTITGILVLMIMTLLLMQLFLLERAIVAIDLLLFTLAIGVMVAHRGWYLAINLLLLMAWIAFGFSRQCQYCFFHSIILLLAVFTISGFIYYSRQKVIKHVAELIIEGKLYRRELELVTKNLDISNERFQDFLENASDMIQIADPAGKIVYVNAAWRETLGYSDEEVRSLNFWDLVPAHHEKNWRAVIGECLQGKRIEFFEGILQTRQGKSIIVSANINAKIVGAKATQTRAILRDISQMTEYALAFIENEKRRKSIIDNVVDGIITLDKAGRIQSFNQAAQTMFGYEPGQIIGESLCRIMPPPPRMTEEEYMQLRLRQRTGDSDRRAEECTGLRSDGTAFPIAIAVSRFHIKEKTHFTAIIRDITQQKKIERDLHTAKELAESASRAKSEFLATMSHELRTPLNSVIGFSNILAKNKGGHLHAKEMLYVSRILDNGKLLLELINDVLDLSKIEAGKYEVHWEIFELPKLIREVTDQFLPSVQEKNITLKVDIPEKLQSIRSDYRFLKQVLYNLIGNAVKFTNEGSVTVTVGVDLKSHTAGFMAVKDTGIGIPKEKLHTIFEEFRQVDSFLNRNYQGTGLGLSIAKSLCNLMGYTIQVNSREGQGSEFIVRFGER